MGRVSEQSLHIYARMNETTRERLYLLSHESHNVRRPVASSIKASIEAQHQIDECRGSGDFPSMRAKTAYLSIATGVCGVALHTPLFIQAPYIWG